MRRMQGGKLEYGSDDSCGSDGSEDESNFKRNKRLRKNNNNQSSVDEVDFPKAINGRKERANAVEVIVHKKVEVKTEDVPIPKTISTNANGASTVFKGGITYRSSATEIMKQMGFDNAKGLGQLTNNCEISAAKLSEMEECLRKEGLIVEEDMLDMEEELPIDEEVKYINPSFPEHPCDYQHLVSWRKVGSRGAFNQRDKFVDPGVLQKLTSLRKCLSLLNGHEYQQIRSRANPFETLSRGPFICRAGLKIANLDASLSYALTQPTTNSADKQSVLNPNELFFFADVCAGPGGFSEYILFRKKWGAKGFGMTLKVKDLDFQIGNFCSGSPESFDPYYGPADDGNVYNPLNTSEFVKHVMFCTEGRGVNLMMADGGFEVGNKELQEALSAQIYLAQCYVALAIVRAGGNFVCKFFDTLTPFTVGLIYLMYLSFDLVAIHKPNTSRPANSERYLICKWKKRDVSGVLKYLATCHEIFWKWTCRFDGDNRQEDIVELVPLDVLNKNKDFLQYIVRSNTVIARKQVTNMEKMVIFARNPNLRDSRQDKMRRRCFEAWKLPSVAPVTNTIVTPVSMCRELNGSQPAEFLGCQEFPLSEYNLEALVRSPYDWRVVVIESDGRDKSRAFYLSLGRSRIYRYEGNNWVHIQEKLELCKETLVYGEFVEEIYGKKPNQTTQTCFHIIDAMILGGTDVRKLHYTARHEVCVKFAKSMNKPSRIDVCHVRAKIPVRMEHIADIFDKLDNRIINGDGPAAQLVCPVDHTDETLPYIRPSGILLLKITKDPWTMALSRSSNRKYYFNLTTGQSKYDLVPESISPFEYTMQSRVVWWWPKDLKTILATQDVTLENRSVAVPPIANSINPQTLLRFVAGEWQVNRATVMRRLSSSSSNHSSS